MKTTIMLTASILFAALIGCSDNLNITGSPDHIEKQVNQQKKPGAETFVGIWKQEELIVIARDEFMVENKAVYTSPPLTMVSSYLVTFDVYTDANKLTNGYIPDVQVYRDEVPLLQNQIFLDPVSEGNNQVKLRLDYVRFNELKFYAALFQGDQRSPGKNNNRYCTLKLSNIRVFIIQ